MPLTAVMPTYFSFQGAIPLRGPTRTRSDSVLDQLPAIPLVIRGKNVVELLRLAYLTLGEEHR